MESKTEQPEVNMIDQARAAAAELRAANEEMKTLLARDERLMAREILGGNTMAGQVPVTVEETPQEYAKRIMRGGQ